MMRNKYKKIYFTILSVVCTCLYMYGNDKPNVLFIAIDDLRTELGCYGADHIISPNIDNLASEGILFERAYCQMAICMASRKSIMSGYRPTWENNMHDRKPLDTNIKNVLTLDQHFQNNGYETINIGKIYHSKKEDTGWTQNYRDLEGPWGSRGYAEERSLKLEAEGKTKGKRGPAYESADVDDNGYQTGAFAQKAIEVLRKMKEENKPFFMGLGFRKPHLPFNAPQKYWDMYKEEDIEVSPYVSAPEGASKYNQTNYGEMRHYYEMPKEGALPEHVVKPLIRGYYACVSYVDAQLGKVLKELDNLGLANNTIIILWSDHGWKLGDYGWWCKHTANEIDTRIPFIVKVPNAKGNGQKSKGLVGMALK